MPTAVALRSASGRWILVAGILGSGVAFLDGSVVNVALPAIGRDVGGGLRVLQWVLDSYLLTLSALLLLGGALGDRYGRRRVFAVGVVLFTLASLGCGLAPTGEALIVARLAQGVGGALLVPGSLALINASIDPDDRGEAVGRWAGLTGMSSALGPFLGGWLVDAASWRWVFFINVPIAAAALLALRHVPESRDPDFSGRLDFGGAAAVTIGLSGTVFALIEVPTAGWDAASTTAAVVGATALVVFPLLERRHPAPLLPLSLLRSSQFVGANLVTLAVYAALSGALFLLSLQLQQTMGYSALQAGIATLPITVIMLLLSGRVGALAQRTGPRIPMTVGPFGCAAGLVLLTHAELGASYLGGVLPGVLVFGLGLSITVAPLTAAVLGSVGPERGGVASGVNNAVSRLAGLLAVAVLPVVAGLAGTGAGAPLGPGFATAMLISAVLCGAGGVLAALTIGKGDRVETPPLPGLNHACQDPACECRD
ncbi:DHA2 family efflux MFS transporter permease subunit [Saccharopolyspora rhizosphaerae]|uniref:DHA2 family efflux MFS transporter permease subunit n=1 Tax=Saccharopolyspora rhizosphaerae TaxID=2492662 RepID=A0A426K5B8_9PSEU|nr:MFS transporter [Saccharopolyspora rhizosphaerae]RRO20591.1 DHA2 family efflux MFS transporter permease subunit [Saccharopolyspora rhizosphaerae]